MKGKGTLQTIVLIIRARLIAWFTKQYRAYIKNKYNSKSDVCFIVGGESKDTLEFYSKVEGKVPINMSDKIRRMVGQHTLMTYGIPNQDSIPHIRLCIMPSAIRRMGLHQTLKLRREWRGSSKVGDNTVVTYS